MRLLIDTSGVQFRVAGTAKRKEAGFLSGEPGMYSVTEKGANSQLRKTTAAVPVDTLTTTERGLPGPGIPRWPVS